MTGDWALYYECSSCGCRKRVDIGSGWGRPNVREVIADIENGRYGQNLKELFQNTEGAEVDENMRLYVCSFCHHFQNEIDLSIYVPRKPEDVSPESKLPFLQVLASYKLPIRHASLRRVRYYWEFWQRPYVHRCEECGRRMHLFRNNDLLRCLDCKEGWMELKDVWEI